MFRKSLSTYFADANSLFLVEPYLGQLEEGHAQDGEQRERREGLGSRQFVAEQYVCCESEDTDQRRDGVQNESAQHEAQKLTYLSIIESQHS